MKIEKIQKQKSGKYKIILDNKETILTYDDVILNNNLLFNKQLSISQLNKINNDTLFYDSYNKAIKYIEKKLRSEKEINKYLDSFDNTYKEQILKKLKELKLINDDNYAKAYISDRIYLSTDGPNKIKKDLLNQGIDISIEEINKINSDIIKSKCEKLILRKINSNTKYSNYVLEQKIISDLLNKGYDLEMIKEIMFKNIKTDKSVIQKEATKILTKLQKKYTDNELYYELKNKLYQKGFKKEEIEMYIKTVE